MRITERRLRQLIRSVIKESQLSEMDRMDFYQDARQQQKELEIDLEKSMTKDEWKDFNATQYKKAFEKSQKLALSGGFASMIGVGGIKAMLAPLIPGAIALIPVGVSLGFFCLACLCFRAVIEKLQDRTVLSRAGEVEKRQKEINRLEAMYQRYYEKTSQVERDFIADMYDLEGNRGSYYIDDSEEAYEHQERWSHMPKPKLDTNRLRRK